MLGGIARICGVCSYKWTLSPAVSQSWPCPRCGGPSKGHADHHVCTCSHRYAEHCVSVEVPPSREAFGLAFNEHGLLEQILATEPQATPEIGTCTLCACRLYTFVAPFVPAADCLGQVATYANRGSGGRDITARRVDDGLVQFERDGKQVDVRVKDDATLELLIDPEESPSATFTMGRHSVGDVVIAVIAALNARRSP